MTTPQVEYYLGLDVGPAQDSSALAVLEVPLPARASSYLRKPAFTLRHLERFVPGTPFPTLVEALVGRLNAGPLEYASVLIDQTAVGGAVADLIVDGLRDRVSCAVTRITLTTGHQATLAGQAWVMLPKKELVGTLQALLQTHRLAISRSVPHAEQLLRELQRFRARITLARPEADLDWRDRPEEDLVLALGLACWMAKMHLPREADAPQETTFRRVW